MNYDRKIETKTAFIPHPEIWHSHNWAKVVSAVNRKYKADIMMYADNKGYVLRDALMVYELNIAIWIDWLAKRCKCGAGWKLLCTITGAGENDGKFGENYELAMAYFGPGYPTCSHYKNSTAFSMAVRKEDDEDRINRERLIYNMLQDPVDWAALIAAEEAKMNPDYAEEIVAAKLSPPDMTGYPNDGSEVPF